MPLLDVDLEIAKTMFDVNVFGVISVTQAFSPMLIRAKGKVLNMGSIVGAFPSPYMGNTNLHNSLANSKFKLTGLQECIMPAKQRQTCLATVYA